MYLLYMCVDLYILLYRASLPTHDLDAPPAWVVARGTDIYICIYIYIYTRGVALVGRLWREREATADVYARCSAGGLCEIAICLPFVGRAA